MSSNIKVQRICQHCGNEFTALTTTTTYCSKQCNSRAYKAKLRAKKIEISNEATQQVKSKPIETLKSKEFLSVKEVSKLLGCSIRTIYYQIENGNLNSYNISQRVTRIRRSDIDKLFEQPKVFKRADETPNYNIEDCYTVTEIIKKYKISGTALNNIAKRNNLPKLKNGKFTYLPKKLIDELLN